VVEVVLVGEVVDVVVVDEVDEVDEVVVEGKVVEVVDDATDVGAVVVDGPCPDPDVWLVVVVVGAGVAGWLTKPKGPLSPGPAVGVLNGLDGRPGWLTPNPMTSANAAAPRATAPSEPTATGRARAARRSRRASVRRRPSSSGVRWPR
jgi:hypothetical protein